VREARADLAGANLVVGSGEEALDATHKRSFDLLVTDYYLPDMDGMALASAIRAIQPKLPIIFATGTDIPWVEALGNTSTISKPYRDQDLQERIEAHLSGETPECILCMRRLNTLAAERLL
jgi:CheY-like chemotaxis protein